MEPRSWKAVFWVKQPPWRGFSAHQLNQHTSQIVYRVSHSRERKQRNGFHPGQSHRIVIGLCFVKKHYGMGTIIGRTRSHASSVSSVLLSQTHSKLVQVAPFVIRIVQTQSSFSFPAQKVKVSRQSKLAASENVIGMRWLMIYVNMLHTAICSTYVCSMSNWTA